jgi:hypothetical protein
MAVPQTHWIDQGLAQLLHLKRNAGGIGR